MPLQVDNQIQNLFVEMLIAIDSTVYALFQDEFGSNTEVDLLNNYIQIFICQIINSVIIREYISVSNLIVNLNSNKSSLRLINDIITR